MVLPPESETPVVSEKPEVTLALLPEYGSE